MDKSGGSDGTALTVNGPGARELFVAALKNQDTPLEPEVVGAIAHEHYGLAVRTERLSGERDQNFRLITAKEEQFVLKISNSTEDASIIDLTTAALLHLEAVDPTFPCPRICRDRRGQTMLRLVLPDGRQRTIRVLTWLEGRMLRSSVRSAAQRTACGRMAARLGVALRGLQHPAAKRPLIWDLRHFEQVRLFLEEMPEFPSYNAILELLETLEKAVVPVLPMLRSQIVHNDLNKLNVLVDPKDETRISGVIDFGDIVHTALIADVAIAANSQITEPGSAEAEVADFLAGYCAVEPLLAEELAILNSLIAARQMMDLLLPAWYRTRNASTDHYAPVSAEGIKTRLEIVRVLIRATFVKRNREAVNRT